jgi:hypothetical protein
MVTIAWLVFWVVLIVATWHYATYAVVYLIARKLRATGWTVNTKADVRGVVLSATKPGANNLWIRYGWWMMPK